ncbi:MAG: arylamine N-acetyltransferase [Steroidobacteraceae bacterium]
MNARIDLDTYFARIGYQGARTPTLDTLQQILQQHTHSIAFENLSSFAGETVPLDLPSLQTKLLQQGRGGYCFEHNTLLWNVLQQLGFSVSGLAARVRWNVPEGFVPPIGHMLMKIVIDDHPYVIDAGFGRLTQTTPLRLDVDTPQATKHEDFRIIYEGPEYMLSADVEGAFRVLYSFSPQEFHASDYEVWNWFTCTAPASPFTHMLMAARPVKDGRHALMNNRYTWRSTTGEVDTRLLTSAADIRAVLSDAFNIRLPESAALNAKLEQLAASIS